MPEKCHMCDNANNVWSDMCRNEEGIFEYLFIEIELGCKDLALGLVYRSPSESVPSFMKIQEEVMALVQKNPCELILMGDFNLNLLDQNSALAADFLLRMLSLEPYIQFIYQPELLRPLRLTLIIFFVTRCLRQFVSG